MLSVMPRLPQPRDGRPLSVKGRPLTFSFFPVRKATRRYGLNDVVFAVDPWAVIEGAVHDHVPSAHRDESLAFVAQSRAFFEAALVRTPASPLLSYYAFLNLGKAIIRARGFNGSLDRAMHGLSETQTRPVPDLTSGVVTVKDGGNNVNVFSELIEQLGYSRPADGTVLAVKDLAPQAVVGHRLWREASNRSERFVVVERFEFVEDPNADEIWLRLWLKRSDLSRYGVTHKRLIAEGGLTGLFAEVDATTLTTEKDLLCLEQTTPVPYSGRPTDVVMDIVDAVRPALWRIVTANPDNGYRRYYLHLTPAADTSRQPQIASLWMLTYYFGSVVRYRPQAFNVMARGRYGAWINDFTAAQPEQLLFMLASEIRRREVARPAIVG